jgi:hypothetical protein
MLRNVGWDNDSLFNLGFSQNPWGYLSTSVLFMQHTLYWVHQGRPCHNEDYSKCEQEIVSQDDCDPLTDMKKHANMKTKFVYFVFKSQIKGCLRKYVKFRLCKLFVFLPGLPLTYG